MPNHSHDELLLVTPGVEMQTSSAIWQDDNSALLEEIERLQIDHETEISFLKDEVDQAWERGMRKVIYHSYIDVSMAMSCCV